MKGRVIGFDFGLHKIGSATGNHRTGTTQALRTIPVTANGPDWVAILALIAEWRAEELVVGLPLRMDGSESPVSAQAKAFAEELAHRSGLAVAMVDERLSSNEADHIITSGAQPGKSRRRQRKSMRDSVAAELIVSTYLTDNPAPLCNQ